MFLLDHDSVKRLAASLRGAIRPTPCAGVVFVATLFAGGCSSPPDSPNVVLITIDTLRPDRLGTYGNVLSRSPNIDRLASSGATFLNAASASAWTLPSMATIMTSNWPARHGAYWVDRKIDPDLPTLASILAKAGYTTAGIHGHLLVSSLYGFGKGFETLIEIDVDVADSAKAWADARSARRNQPTAGVIAAAAKEWLESTPKEPFFLWVHFFDPHLPYTPPKEWRSAFDPGPADRLQINGRPPQKYFKVENPMPETMRDRLLRLYDGEIFNVDEAIGDLLATYKDLFRSDPILVITSDHGEEFKEHGRLSHTKTLYGELVRVPLLFHGPSIPARALVRSNAQTIDIAPTLLSLLHIPIPPALQGRALSFGDGAETPRTIQLSETRNRTWADTTGSDASGESPLLLRSVREGKWKLILSILDDRRELYDLDADVAEEHDLAAERPDVVERLSEIYEEERAGDGAFAGDTTGGAGESFQLKNDQVERLRALGYIK